MPVREGVSGVAWGAVRAVAAAERRTGMRALLLFGVLFGLFSGLVLGTVALAERTASAYPRLADAVGLDDVRLQVPADQRALAAQVPYLPDVQKAWVTYGWVARIEGASVRYVALGAGQDQPPGLVRPIVVAGRAPADGAADEIMISEPLAEGSDLRVGTAVTIRILTLDQIARFGSGVGDPEGPILRMWVVGIARMPSWGGPLAEARPARRSSSGTRPRRPAAPPSSGSTTTPARPRRSPRRSPRPRRRRRPRWWPPTCRRRCSCRARTATPRPPRRSGPSSSA